MRSDVIELVFVDRCDMCLNAQHPMMPTFGWKWDFRGVSVTATAKHPEGWQLDYVGRHPDNIYVYLFVLNSGINEMYSDLPPLYWEDMEKMIATMRLAINAAKRGAFLDVMMYEMIMTVGDIAMSDTLDLV